MKEPGRGHASIYEKSKVPINDVWIFGENRISSAGGI